MPSEALHGDDWHPGEHPSLDDMKELMRRRNEAWKHGLVWAPCTPAERRVWQWLQKAEATGSAGSDEELAAFLHRHRQHWQDVWFSVDDGSG